MNRSQPITARSRTANTIDCTTFPEGQFSFVARAWGEDQSFDSAQASLMVDRTPPTIVKWRPTSSAPAAGEPMEIVFSEPIDPGSLGDAPTTLRGDSGFSVAHRYRRHRSSGWAPEQLVSGGFLMGFQVDDRGFPLVAAEYVGNDGATILRPQ